MNKSVAPITINIASQWERESSGCPKPSCPKPSASKPFSHLVNPKTGALVSAAIAAVAGLQLVPIEQYATQYEGKLQLSLEPKGGNASLANPDAAQVQISAPSIDYETQARVLWSPKLLSPVVAQLQKQYPNLDYDRLSHNLKINHPEGSNLLEMSYQDTDAQRTQAVLERLAQTYLKYSQESPANNRSVLQFIEQRVPQLQQEVARTQEKIQQFQQQYGSTHPDQLGQQLSTQSNALTQQQQELYSQLIEARTAYTVLQQRSAQSFGQILETQLLDSQLLNQQNPRYQALLNQFQVTAIQLATERPDSALVSNREKHQGLEQQYRQLSEQLAQTVQQPLIDRLSQVNSSNPANFQEVRRLETLIELNVADNRVRMLEISYGAIAQTKALLGAEIKQWAGLARQYDALQLESQLATHKLNLSLAKQAELQTFIQSAWHVIAPAQVKPMAERGLMLSDSQRSLSLVLCFMVVVWAMTTWKDTGWKDKNRKNANRENAERSQKHVGSPLPALQPDFQQSLKPLVLQMPKVKILYSIEDDYNLLPNLRNDLSRKTADSLKRLVTK